MTEYTSWFDKFISFPYLFLSNIIIPTVSTPTLITFSMQPTQPFHFLFCCCCCLLLPVKGATDITNFFFLIQRDKNEWEDDKMRNMLDKTVKDFFSLIFYWRPWTF